MLVKEDLITALWQQLSVEATAWLETSLDNISAGAPRDDVSVERYLQYSAMARRKLGNTALVMANHSHWGMDEAGRLVLLMQWLNLYSVVEQVEMLNSVYRLVDENEKQVIAKGFALLDKDGAAVDLAVSIGRTNNINLFAAIALNNEYPSAHYQERAFNQLVLKALFMDLDIGGMVGLKQRLGPALSSLCMDLVKERLAADRPPPFSICLAINPTDLSSDDQTLHHHFISNQSLC